MSEADGVTVGYERLLRDRLTPTEVLDGILVGPTLTAAVTSERLLIVGPAKPNGWQMKSLPWYMVTEMALDAPEGGGTDEQVVHLHYLLPTKASRHKAPAWLTAPGPGANDNVDTGPSVELILMLPSDGGRMADLLSAHIADGRPQEQP